MQRPHLEYFTWLDEKLFVKSCPITIRPFHHTTFAHFYHFCTLFTILQLFGQLVITFSYSVTMFIMLYHVWHGFFYHFHHFIRILTLFGTLSHLSPQLFTLISPTILLVVYYFYYLSPLSQSFANFTSLHWHLNEHWLIWKVVQYTISYPIFVHGIRVCTYPESVVSHEAVGRM